MSKIPSLEEMLKLYTKKDLWERIQQHIQTIDQLKQQLAEKDKNFHEYRNEVVSNIEKEVNERMRDNLKEHAMQLAEKDKEIKVRNDKLGKLKKQLTDCLNSLKRKTQSNRDLQSIRYKANRQFAIQELEKVKTLIQNAINFERPNFVEVYDAINKQIKKLKGEKDE